MEKQSYDEFLAQTLPNSKPYYIKVLPYIPSYTSKGRKGISFYATEKLVKEFKAACNSIGATPSAVVRGLVIEFVKEVKARLGDDFNRFLEAQEILENRRR